MAKARLSTFEIVCLSIALAGVALRLLAFSYRQISFDPGTMMAMGEGLRRYGEFLIPGDTGALEYSHHFPPLFPVVLAGFFTLFGTTAAAAQAAAVAQGVFFVLVAFLCTADLYGRRIGLAVAAVAATFPTLLLQDTILYSESFVSALFALTIWAVIKSLDRPAFIVLGGAFAALTYLVKASMGPFFVLAGAGGFAWRFYYVRWRIFTDKYYLTAGAILGTTVVLWSWRNVLRFGWPHYETQAHASDAFSLMFQDPRWPVVLFQEALWSGVILLIFMLPWLPQFRASLRDIRDQKVSALWLSIGTTAIIGTFFVAAFFIYEKYHGIRTETNVRYLTAAILPMYWIGMRALDLAPPAEAGPRKGDPSLIRKHGIVVGIGVTILAALLALDPLRVFVSPDRVIVTYVVMIIGILVLCASGLFAWRETERNERGTRVRHVAHDPDAWRLVGRGVVYALIALLVFTFGFVVSIIYTLPAVAQAFVRDPRAKVVIVAILFLAAGFAGVQESDPIEEIAHDLNARAAPGASVMVTASSNVNLTWVWIFLRPDIQLTSNASDADYQVETTGAVTPPHPPEGYHTVAAFKVRYVRGPGTWLEERIEAAAGQPPLHPDTDAYVYERNVTS